MRLSLPPQEELLGEIAADSIDAANQARYIQTYAYCPVYTNTYTDYLPLGEIKFEWMKEELRKAEHYILPGIFHHSGRPDVGRNPGNPNR